MRLGYNWVLGESTREGAPAAAWSFPEHKARRTYLSSHIFFRFPFFQPTLKFLEIFLMALRARRSQEFQQWGPGTMGAGMGPCFGVARKWPHLCASWLPEMGVSAQMTLLCPFPWALTTGMAKMPGDASYTWPCGSQHPGAGGL